jgi:hypothetical protein
VLGLRRGAAAFAAACLLGFAAWAADSQEKIFELTITAGALPLAQRVMRVEKDDAVRWRITSDSAGDLHLHAYRLEAKLVPGKPVEISFKAFATGSYRVEWHAAAGTANPRGAHRTPPLATLEVHPR